jgi:hypothetical protein
MESWDIEPLPIEPLMGLVCFFFCMGLWVWPDIADPDIALECDMDEDDIESDDDMAPPSASAAPPIARPAASAKAKIFIGECS